MRNRNVVVAGVIAGLVAACADAVSDGAGRAMVDAGEAMQDAGQSMGAAGSGALAGAGSVLDDAGQALADAGGALIDAATDGGTASAAEPVILEADCDTESGVRVVQPDDSWTETISFYASAEGSERYPENLAGVVALLCGWDDASPSLGAPECDGDVDCVETGDYPRQKPDCMQTSEIEIMDGGRLTVNCGVEQDSSAGVPRGGHWQSVRFMIPAR